MNRAAATLHWVNLKGVPEQGVWHSIAALPAPQKLQCVDDRTPANEAYRLACEGTYLLWLGDFHNAKQLLQALARRIDTPPKRKKTAAETSITFPLVFHQHRHKLAQRANVLNKLLIPLAADNLIPLRRAPNVQAACHAAYGADEMGTSTLRILPLRELLGVIGAYEWQKKGVFIPALQAKIHPYYGVFSPVRGEYIDLVAQAPLPAGLQTQSRAFEIGIGSGVLSAVLAQRGIAQVIATDQDPRALACATDNLTQLGYATQVQCIQADLFPAGQAPLVVCNPPWLPAKPSSPIEYAVYDPDSRMLRAFLQGLAAHLTTDGEAWLILSDLAEHLKLRSREELLGWIAAAGLQVVGRIDTQPKHSKAQEREDPLFAARRLEVTSLWRLAMLRA